MASRTQNKPTNKGNAQAAAVAPIEFTAAAHEHTELAFDVTQTPGASQVTLGPFDVPAVGFLRHIFLLVTCSGGTGGTAAADAPWSLIKEVVLYDVNGAPVTQLTGFQLFLANLFGGYVFKSDPTAQPGYVGTTPNFVFGLRIPVEISHNNGLGAISNQNAASAYQVKVTLAPLSDTWSVNPSPVPSVRIQGWLEAWTQPAATDPAGRPQLTLPPRHGTTQYWSYSQYLTVTGAYTVPIKRVGNLLRNIIVVARNSSGARVATSLPDPVELRLDTRQLLSMPAYLMNTYLVERGIISSVPTGVYVFGWTHDVLGHAGDGTPELWIPTAQATRLEIVGTFGAGAASGSVDIIVNDVAPVETDPAARFVETSATGFHPAI